MGRPRSTPTERKEIRLEVRQIELLAAMCATAPLGEPSFVSLVRQAIDEFITREMAKPDVRSRVDGHLKDHRKVVGLRRVKQDT